MFYQRLSDEEILNGFRKGNAAIIREFFYGYCRVGYNMFDHRYQLSGKENLDFMSLAHQYALYLMEHDWKPLEDHSPEVSLKTWLIGGFRYVVLDALKWYHKEYGTITFEDYLCSFDAGDDLRLQFNRMVEDVCNHALLSRDERMIIDMLLLRGYKVKEIAELMGMTPSAISQKYKQLKERIIIPYFRKFFDMDMDMPEVMDAQIVMRSRESSMAETKMSMPSPKPCSDMDFSICMDMEIKRTTPRYISALQPNEIFVFGSNLKGMHGGGAAYTAYSKFGAIMGQGAGLQGQSYGIPTMQGGVETIRPYVDEFIQFAKDRQDLTFLVTRIGCGIAGFTEKEISPLFKDAHHVRNIILPEGW